jgi:SAM-dependent methyltransferase
VQQASGNPGREQRFQVMIGLGRQLVGETPLALDLGSGPGSLARRLVEALPGARVVAIDADPLLVELGRQAVGDRGGRISWLDADIRTERWVETVRAMGQVDAVISTTALHWLSQAEQTRLFEVLAELIRPGRILGNADHLTFDPDQPRIAEAVRSLQAEAAEREQAAVSAETWGQWWEAIEADQSPAQLVAERKRRWGRHPDYHTLGEALFMEAALKRAGLTEAGIVWQLYPPHEAGFAGTPGTRAAF